MKSTIRVVQTSTKVIRRFLAGSVPEPCTSYQIIENHVVAQREESLLSIDPAASILVVDEHVIQDTPGPHLVELL